MPGSVVYFVNSPILCMNKIKKSIDIGEIKKSFLNRI